MNAISIQKSLFTILALSLIVGANVYLTSNSERVLVNIDRLGPDKYSENAILKFRLVLTNRLQVDARLVGIEPD